MRKEIKVLAIVIISIFCFVTGSHAALIIDTGAPSETGGVGLYRQGDDYQYLAGKILLTQAYTLSGIQGWMYGQPGSLTISIYGDSGEIPDTANLIHQGGFSIVDTGNGYIHDWYGLSGLNWDLGAGNYWVAFEVLPGQTYNGHMPVNNDLGNPFTPLSDYANSYLSFNPGNYNAADNNTFGLRVYDGQFQSTVPEPASLSFLGLGLAGLIFKRKKRIA
jgi:hypothetical protein